MNGLTKQEIIATLDEYIEDNNTVIEHIGTTVDVLHIKWYDYDENMNPMMCEEYIKFDKIKNNNSSVSVMTKLKDE